MRSISGKILYSEAALVSRELEGSYSVKTDAVFWHRNEGRQ